jgi:hypothetical protein
VVLFYKTIKVNYNKYKYCLIVERIILENCQTQRSVPSTAPYTTGCNSSKANILAWNSFWIQSPSFLYKQKKKPDTGISELEKRQPTLFISFTSFLFFLLPPHHSVFSNFGS